MIKVSSEFFNALKTRTDFKEYADITLKNGTVLKLNETDFTFNNNSVTDAADCDSFPIGVAIARHIQIELMNDEDQFSTYDFFGAKIKLYLVFELEKTSERIEFGTFTVVSPVGRRTTILINAVDDMYKLDKPYDSNLVYPQKLSNIYTDIGTKCGIPVKSGSEKFLNNDLIIQDKPGTDTTYRQVLGYVSMFACGNARINRFGQLEILTYDFKFLSSLVDGGHFKPWDQLSDTDGGTFNPWNTGVVIDGGGFTQDNMTYHTLTDFKNIDIDTDDITITGVEATYTDESDEEQTLMVGEEGYVLSLENPMFGTQKSTVAKILQVLGSTLNGVRIRRFTGDHIAYPLIEFMDNVIITDVKGNMYTTVATDVNFNFFGFTNLKNSIDNPIHNDADYRGQGAKIIATTKQLVSNEKLQRESDIQALKEDINTASSYTIINDSSGNPSAFILKTADGIMKIVQKVEFTVDISQTWGNVFNYSVDMGTWVEPFGNTPMIVSVTPQDNAGWFMESIQPHTVSSTSIGTMWLMRPIKGSITGIAVITAIGKRPN